MVLYRGRKSDTGILGRDEEKGNYIDVARLRLSLSYCLKGQRSLGSRKKELF